ncbi:EAL domain-containing protein [Wenzhouxiangella sp. XN201]|uniref:putative bifunctional diguanylate cyclase/phosphodiesterase n=1 Tax=Wenzhouxiangella sp. XN201 TaxID=2710755 RepID=UPI0013CCCA86|nr:GGDEF domain-containing phosphodiesterase [Wenzhouxiangella sp. XN201]NEZ04294.1 EAL domain-containing protein [Wenzhouxiangella sp. XN201]
MKLPALSLRTKLAVAVLVASAILLGALALLWVTGTRNNEALVAQSSEAILDNALADLRLRGEVTLEHLAEVLPNLVYYYDFSGLSDSLSPVLARPDVEYVIVYDLEGRLIHDGTRVLERFGERMDDALAEQVIAATGTPGEVQAYWGDDRLDVSRTLMLGSVPLGGVRIGLSRAAADRLVAEEQAELETQLRGRFDSQIRWLLAAFTLLLLGAAIAGWLIARQLLRPIRALATSADRLEHGQFDQVEIPIDRGDELGKLVQSFNRMAVALRDHDREIRRLAYQDPLTSLPNRLMFRELLDQAVTEQEHEPDGLGLLFIDLDDFKRINDTLGHDTGDEVLAEFSERLQHQASDFAGESENQQPIIARLGGDEFVALLSGADIRQRCTRLARSILSGLNEPFTVDGRQLFLSASIGVSILPDDARSARKLLKCGDLAMYQAKLEGKNGLFFYRDHLTMTAEENLQLEQALRESLALDQIELYYQPLVELATGRVTGAEALLRWHHPDLGEIDPERFIAVAESSTLIDELGRWVIDRACADAATWQRSRPNLRVGINISGRQLLRRDLVEQIDAALERNDLPANSISLELTESTLLHDRALASEILLSLRAREINIWLDDFGTGFSGLNHLRQLRVSGVKIDRSFIADILTDPDDLALSSAIIAMAHSVGMRVIAEGVEAPEQLELLRQRGCDVVQGFLLARPMPAAEIPDFYPNPEWFPDASG